jgi:carboxyl-terminal processing protease
LRTFLINKGFLLPEFSIPSLAITAACLLLFAPSPYLDANSNVPVVEFNKVSATSEQTTKLITNLIGRYHYRKPELTDALSSAIFKQYLINLDPNHSYFLASDIEQFENLRFRFDDMLKSVRLEPAYAIFSRYRIRALERIAYAQSLLDAGFDFKVDEYYTVNREHESWALNTDELNELWRKRVKYDWLALKLSGKTSDDIADTLSTRYLNMGRRIRQIKEGDVFELLMNTYLSTVEPHTGFFSPRATENFKIRMSLSLEGIGAVLQMDGEYTLVHRVLPGGPADLSEELHGGDRITGVAQGEEEHIVDVVGWRLDDVVDLIRGPKGSLVRLQILPKNEPPGGTNRVIQIRRDTIKLEEQAARQSVLHIDSHEGPARIGVITIPTFYVDFDARARGDKDYRSTTSDVRQLLSELLLDEIDALIIDLRGNGGGALTEAISVTGLFIHSGPIVQVRDSRGKVNIRKDPDPDIFYSGPLVIMVDRDSASASEIFAGAIQDYNRGFIVGESTFGKGTVQNLIDLDRYTTNDSEPLGQLKITVAQFFRVTGEGTQHRGVVPDFVLPVTQYRRDQRESSQENALSWSQIKAARYRSSSTNLIENSDIQLIRKRHATRVANSAGFQYMIEKARLDQNAAETISFSLLESQRRTERALQEQEAQLLETKFQESLTTDSDSQAETEDLATNEILLEAGRILVDILTDNNFLPALANRDFSYHQPITAP